jgi:CRP/FNR family cyclic AMP-dependent transcriptional regulator
VARILTVGPGEVVGWSWLIPPHRWQFDAHAIERVRVIALNAACLRAACEANHDLGYEVCRRLLGVIALRLAATRVQLMDVYR